jgi:hypothetical protein
MKQIMNRNNIALVFLSFGLLAGALMIFGDIYKAPYYIKSIVVMVFAVGVSVPIFFALVFGSENDESREDTKAREILERLDSIEVELKKLNARL